MRYHDNAQPQEWTNYYGSVYRCNHPVYRVCTLYKERSKGLCVIQQRYNKESKATYWSAIDPWLTDKIYLHAIERAINGVNKQLLSDFRVTENDLFDYLGMEHNRNGDLFGWDTDTTMEVETFYASKLDEDGMPCLVLDYRTPPKWLGY